MVFICLYTGAITWKVNTWGPVKCGLYKQVVFKYRGSLKQVWLYVRVYVSLSDKQHPIATCKLLLYCICTVLLYLELLACDVQNVRKPTCSTLCALNCFYPKQFKIDHINCVISTVASTVAQDSTQAYSNTYLGRLLPVVMLWVWSVEGCGCDRCNTCISY